MSRDDTRKAPNGLVENAGIIFSTTFVSGSFFGELGIKTFGRK